MKTHGPKSRQERDTGAPHSPTQNCTNILTIKMVRLVSQMGANPVKLIRVILYECVKSPSYPALFAKLLQEITLK